MLTVLALAMILVFIILLAKKKISVFAALTLIPLLFGFLAVLVTDNTVMDLFGWIKSGIFFKVKDGGKVSMGTISPGIMILFSILYFDVMLNVGLFDPIAKFFIRKAKGDPMKVLLSTVMVASIVSLNGDTTTTIIICLAAFLNLYKQLNLKLSYLAIVIVAPIGIWNQLPWGGPTIACATALGVELSELFAQLLPGLLAAQVVVILIAWYLGKKERARLGFTDGKKKLNVSEADIQQMLAAIDEKDPELKRPKLYWFNLTLTLLSLALLIKGDIHGSIIFMLALAIALVVNYRTPEACTERLEELSADALPTAVITLGAGVFSGILSGSGMATALASSIASMIPTAFGSHMAPIYAVIAAPAICFLPQDAFYFGIASVISGVMAEFGISAMEVAVASMVGQSFRLISPVIPALYMLCGETKMNFFDFQKTYTKYFWAVIVTYLVVYGVTGVLPY